MQIEIAIEKLAYGGEGIGYKDGKVCFVEGALPGEIILAEIIRDKKNYSRGRLVKIIQSSPHRIPAPCVYIDQCGGCQYQHLEYAEELRWKEIQVREYLERNLRIDPALVLPIVPSPNPYEYRTSVTLHKAGPKSGFVGRDNETVIPIDQCLLTHPGLKPAFETYLKEDSKTFRISGDGKIYSSSEETLFEMQSGIVTHSKSFFQNNLPVTRAVGETVKKWTEESEPDFFMDLYAGCGTFALLAAEKANQILCIEENPFSLEALQENFKKRSLKGTVLQGKVEDVFPAWVKTAAFSKAFVFLDPPRKGMPEKLCRFLSKQASLSDLVYLSCHLGTLTRDLKLILESGKFQIREAIPFDMFPRTKHIEVLVRLQPL